MIVINNRTDRPWFVCQIWRGVTGQNIQGNWVFGDEIEVADIDTHPSKILFRHNQCSLPFSDLFKVMEVLNPDTERFYKEV